MRQRCFLGCTIIIFLLIPLLVSAQDQAHRRPDLDRLFFRQQGWIGGDGAFSVPLKKDRILWLFGDTFIGRIENGRRARIELVNNTIGLQTRKPFSTSRTRYFLPRSSGGKPMAFFRPPDKKGWFWPLHGVVTSRGLFVFLLQTEKTDEHSAFGFRNSGLWLARISNPQASPGKWFVSYRRVPWGMFGPNRNLYWGSAILEQGGFRYVFGIDESPNISGNPKKLVVARVAPESPDSFGEWEFWTGTGWARDFRKVAPLQEGLAAEFSVTANGAGGLDLIYSQAGFSRNILHSSAPAPEGPWAKPTVVYTIDEKHPSRNAFFYAAKAHPHLSVEAKGLITSYVCNSLDFWEPLKFGRMYWPRFVELCPLPGGSPRRIP